MIKNNIFKCAIAIMIVITSFSSISFGSSAVPLQSVPSDVLFCVGVNNLDATLGRTDQFLSGVSPIPLGLSMMVRMQLASILGNPQLAGLDTGGNWLFIGKAQAMSPVPEILVLVPVTDFDQLATNAGLTAKGNNCWQATVNMKTLTLTKLTDNYALMCDYSDVNQVTALAASMNTGKSLAERMPSLQQQSIKDRSIWIWLNSQALWQTYQTQILGGMEQLKTQMSTQAASGNAGFNGMIGIFDSYTDIIKTVLGESDSGLIGLDITADMLTITEAYDAKAGSCLASILTITPKTQANTVQGFLRKDAFLNLCVKNKNPIVNDINKWAVGLMKNIAKDDLDEEATKALLESYDKIHALTGDYGAISMYQPAPASSGMFSFSCAAQTTDSKEYLNLTKGQMELFGGDDGLMAKMYKNMGINSSINITDSDYNGTDICNISIPLATAGPNSPMPHETDAVIKSIYGSNGFTYQVAGVNNFVLGSVGDNSINPLIDKAKTGQTLLPPDEYKNAVAMLTNQDSDIVGTFNIVHLFKLIMTMQTMMTGQPAPALEVASSSNIAFAVTIGTGRITSETIIPKAHIQEVLPLIQTLQQQQMQQRPITQPDHDSNQPQPQGSKDKGDSCCPSSKKPADSCAK